MICNFCYRRAVGVVRRHRRSFWQRLTGTPAPGAHYCERHLASAVEYVKGWHR